MTPFCNAIFYLSNGDFKLARLTGGPEEKQLSEGTLYFVTAHGQLLKIISSTKNVSWNLKRVQHKTKESQLEFADILEILEKRRGDG